MDDLQLVFSKTNRIGDTKTIFSVVLCKGVHFCYTGHTGEWMMNRG